MGTTRCCARTASETRSNGSVSALKTDRSSNRTLSDVEFAEYSRASNPAMIKRARNYVEPVFETRENAIEFAREAGFELSTPLVTAEVFGEIISAITANAARDVKQAKKSETAG